MADEDIENRVSYLQKRKWSDRTVARYDSTNEQMRRWLAENDPTSVDADQKIILPMQFSSIKKYFDRLMEEKEEADKRETYGSFS